MTDAIIVALITGACALIGQLLVGKSQNDKTIAVIEERLSWSDKLTEREIGSVKKNIDLLSARVDKHNNFAQRLPVVEEQIRELNHRVEDLEKNGA